MERDGAVAGAAPALTYRERVDGGDGVGGVRPALGHREPGLGLVVTLGVYTAWTVGLLAGSWTRALDPVEA